jgi:DNA-binding transcriptional LysR family regulator
MELRQLQTFLVLAEELHFGRAAERLALTQPALSKQIASLEQRMGVQLLFRTKRTVALTPAGQVFVSQAQQLLAQAEAALRLTQRTAKGEAGQLTLGFTETAIHTVLPGLVRQFRQAYPQVELILHNLTTEGQVTGLNEGKLDLAFLHPPIDPRGLTLQPILSEDFVAVLPPDHPLLSYEQIPIVALAPYPLMIHPRAEGPVLYDGFLQICEAAGFQPQIAQESISLQTRVCFVAAGLGITFVSERLQFLVGPNVVCRPLADCPIRLQFAAAWRKNSTSPTLRAFLGVVQGIECVNVSHFSHSPQRLGIEFL